MPVEVVSYMLSNKDIRMRLGFQLILQCAPFLKGIKVASITNVDRRHLKEFWRVLDGTGIDAKILTVSQEISGVVWIRQERFGLDSSKTLCKGLSIYL